MSKSAIEFINEYFDLNNVSIDADLAEGSLSPASADVAKDTIEKQRKEALENPGVEASKLYDKELKSKLYKMKVQQQELDKSYQAGKVSTKDYKKIKQQSLNLERSHKAEAHFTKMAFEQGHNVDNFISFVKEKGLFDEYQSEELGKAKKVSVSLAKRFSAERTTAKLKENMSVGKSFISHQATRVMESKGMKNTKTVLKYAGIGVAATAAAPLIGAAGAVAITGAAVAGAGYVGYKSLKTTGQVGLGVVGVVYGTTGRVVDAIDKGVAKASTPAYVRADAAFKKHKAKTMRKNQLLAKHGVVSEKKAYLTALVANTTGKLSHKFKKFVEPALAGEMKKLGEDFKKFSGFGKEGQKEKNFEASYEDKGPEIG